MLNVQSAKTKHAAALQRAEAILAAAGNQPLTDDAQRAFDAAMAEATSLEASVARLEEPDRFHEALNAMVAGAKRTPGGLVLKPATPSLGAELLASEIGKWLRDTKGTRSGTWRSPSVELMAATLTEDPASGGALVQPQVLQPIIPTPLPQTTVLDLLASGNTSSNAINSLVETLFTNAADAVAEGAVKPESTLTFAGVMDPVRKVAHWLPVSDELLEDEPGMQSYVDQRLKAGVRVALDRELLNGSGVAPHIDGILNRDGLAAPVAQGAGGPLDAIAQQIGAIETATNLTVDGIVLNPTDWLMMQLLKDSNGNYLGGSPFTGSPGTLWGRRVAPSTGMAAGTALVGAFKTAAMVFLKGGLRVEISNSHSDYFIRNLLAIRAEVRAALAVFRPAAFGKVTGIAAPAPA